MPSVLLVDDDPLILRVYGKGLAEQGFEVATATDGLEAIQLLRASRPEALVLDLMMPRLSGVDVLKFVRSNPGLASMPVLLLSNSYMGELEKAAPARFERALLKVRCNPKLLAEAIRELWSPGFRPAAEEPAPPAPPPAPASQPPTEAAPTAAPAPRAPAAAPAAAPPLRVGAAPVLDVPGLVPGMHVSQPLPATHPAPSLNPREEFLERAFSTANELKLRFDAFCSAPSEGARRLKAQDLCRRVHFLAAAAGLAEFPLVAEAASASAAFLFEVGANLDLLSPSMLRTAGQAIELIVDLLTQLGALHSPGAGRPQAILVTADPSVNRPIGMVLRQAGIAHRVFQDKEAALLSFLENPGTYAVLDCDLPRKEAWELSTRLLDVTPAPPQVLLLPDQEQFDLRLTSPPVPNLDFVLKPVFPMEVALKLMLHWIRAHAFPGAA